MSENIIGIGWKRAKMYSNEPKPPKCHIISSHRISHVSPALADLADFAGEAGGSAGGALAQAGG